MKILGIDEAGKGPVVGPLIICGYMIDSKKRPLLKDLGVKDSKLLTPAFRERIAPKLRELADDHIILKLDAHEIDNMRTSSNLNVIEMKRMQSIINAMKPDKVIVDAFEYNTKRFKEKLVAGLNKEMKSIEIVCENFADKNHIEVGAASVLAKVCRDEHIKKLHKQYGFQGSGYSSDPVTIAFLKAWMKKNNSFPPFVRKSWITAQIMMEEKEQTKLNKFMGG